MNNIKMLIKPPRKLWQVVQLAIKDIKQVVKRKNIKLDMDWWLAYDKSYKEEVCFVCLAGATLINHTDKKLLKELYNEDDDCNLLDVCSKGWKDGFEALENVRTGFAGEAVASFYGKDTDEVDFDDNDIFSDDSVLETADFENNFGNTIKELQARADELKSLNL